MEINVGQNLKLGFSLHFQFRDTLKLTKRTWDRWLLTRGLTQRTRDRWSFKRGFTVLYCH